MSSSISEELKEIILNLSGDNPSWELINSLENNLLREWAKLRGVSSVGQLKTIKARLMSSFAPATPSSSQPPPAKNRRTKASTSARPSLDDHLSASDEDSEDSERIESFADNHSDVVSSLRDLSDRLYRMEEAMSLNRHGASDSSRDWWVSKVCTFQLGPFIRSKPEFVKTSTSPFVEIIKLTLKEHLAGKIPAVSMGKLLSPAFKKLIEWTICTVGCWDFSHLEPHSSIIQLGAEKSANRWALDIFDANELVEPPTGERSLILSERISTAAREIAKQCELKMDAKGARL